MIRRRCIRSSVMCGCLRFRQRHSVVPEKTRRNETTKTKGKQTINIHQRERRGDGLRRERYKKMTRVSFFSKVTEREKTFLHHGQNFTSTGIMTSTPIEGEGINLKWIKNTREKKKRAHSLSHARQKLVAISTHSDVEGKWERQIECLHASHQTRLTQRLNFTKRKANYYYSISHSLFFSIFLVVFFFSFLCQVTVFQLKTIEEHARHYPPRQIKIKDCAVRSCNISPLIWSKTPKNQGRITKKNAKQEKVTIRDDNISKCHPGIYYFSTRSSSASNKSKESQSRNPKFTRQHCPTSSALPHWTDQIMTDPFFFFFFFFFFS